MPRTNKKWRGERRIALTTAWDAAFYIAILPHQQVARCEPARNLDFMDVAAPVPQQIGLKRRASPYAIHGTFLLFKKGHSCQ